MSLHKDSKKPKNEDIQIQIDIDKKKQFTF